MSAAGDSGDAFRRFVQLSRGEQKIVLGALSNAQATELRERWIGGWARAAQLPPPGDWRVWLIRAGRGFGKTRAGAEWVTEVAARMPGAKIALVGATRDDVRRVMVEGTSGLLAVAKAGAKPRWRKSQGEVHFASGAIGYVFSAETPDALRGPEHHAAWCDELAKWRMGAETWENLVLTLRVGRRPQVVVTTTPRPTKLMRTVMAEVTAETLGHTRDNPHLAASFKAAIADHAGNARLQRQELGGELIEDADGALWTRVLLDASRVSAAPPLVRVVVGVDPPAGSSGDACGIVAIGRSAEGTGYVLEDASRAGLRPEGWARAVAACAARHGAHRVVAELNQGGAMVESVLQAADVALPVKLVHASKGKTERAAPVLTHYECGRIKHVGTFAELEDELCGLTWSGRYEGPGRSPDRADALVHAAQELMGAGRTAAAIRCL